MSQHRIHITNAETHTNETTPGFYTNNTFQLDNPAIGLKWLASLTPQSVQQLRKVYCFVTAVYNPGPRPDFMTNEPANGPIWCHFVRELSEQATGLQEIAFYFDAEPSLDKWGAGVDVNFVRALGCLSGLQRVEIQGYFRDEWPCWLERKKGIKALVEQREEQWYWDSLRKYQRPFRGQVIEG